MKRRIQFAGSLAAFGIFVTLLTAAADGCTPFGRSLARGAIDVLSATCIVANSGKTDEDIRQICGIVDALDGPMRELLKTSREQTRLARARGEFAGDVRCHFATLKDGGSL